MPPRHGGTRINFLEAGEPVPPKPLPLPPPVGEEAGENVLDLCHMLNQFTRIITAALHGRHNTETLDIKRVNKLGAHDYFGSANLGEAKGWLIDVEKVFEVMRYPNEDRVRLTAFLLKENVYHWWKTIHSRYADPTTITWVEFQYIFDEQFCLSSFRDLKRDEFLRLKHKVMSVLKYEQKFNKLSRFALELIPTKTETCRQFEEGLWLDIQAGVMDESYPFMRTLAQVAYGVLKKINAGVGRCRLDMFYFGGPSQGSSKRGGSNSDFASNGWSGERESSSGSEGSEPRPN